jgi:hypothetical protein
MGSIRFQQTSNLRLSIAVAAVGGPGTISSTGLIRMRTDDAVLAKQITDQSLRIGVEISDGMDKFRPNNIEQTVPDRTGIMKGI